MKRTLKIDRFRFEPDKVLVQASLEELPSYTSSMGYVAISGYSFSPEYLGFLRDMVVVNAIAMYGLFVDSIVVDVPVTSYVCESLEDFLTAINSWTGLLSRGPVKVPISFDQVQALTSEQSQIFDIPYNNNVIVGWSNGKESKACIAMAKELGQQVETIAVGFGNHNDHASFVSLFNYGTLHSIANITDIFPELKGRHFVFQSNSGPGIYAALLLSCRICNSSGVLVGAEYSTGVSLGGKYDLGCDEGYPTIKWFNDYIGEVYGGNVRVYSPVATLTEVGIIRYNLLKGITFREFESCWYFEKVGKRNCEGCTKCNRMKMYGLYLVSKGHMGLHELEEAYSTLDYPRLSTPMTSAFSWISEAIQRDIMSCNPAFDWSLYYLDHPHELEVTGPYIEVVRRYFKKVHWQHSAPSPNIRFNIFDNEYCRNEFYRVYGFDYWDYLPPGYATQDGNSYLFMTGWCLPYEHFFYEGTQNSFTDWFDVWPTYLRDGSFAGNIRITDVPGYKWNKGSGFHRYMPRMHENSILRRWLVLEDIVRFFEQKGIRYELEIEADPAWS